MSEVSSKIDMLESKVRKLLNDRKEDSIVQVVNKESSSYASMTDPDDITASTVYTTWTFNTSHGSGLAVTTSKITSREKGYYLINVNLGFQSNGGTTYVSLHFNGAADLSEFYQTPDYNRLDTNVYSISMSGVRALSTGDYIELKVKSSSASGVIYGVGGGIAVLKIK